MDKNKRYSLSRRDCELLRIVASVSVVIVHCIHFWVEGFFTHRQLWSVGFWATGLDQLTRFTVPAFFFLSGFGLASQFRNRPPGFLDFYRRRVFKILTPFLIWSAITGVRHFDFLVGLSWQERPWHTARYFFKFLFCDGFDYQYYFLIVIFQFYLLFPLLVRVGRSRWALGVFFLLHLALTSPVETYLELAGLRLPGLHPNLWLFYAFYGVAGIHIAWHPEFLAGILRRWSPGRVLGFWFAAYALVLLEYAVNLGMGKNLYDTDHFNRWSVVLYCLACLLVFLKAKETVVNRIHGHPGWRFLYSGVAPYTFFVYLVHTHVLRGVDFLFWEITAWDFVARMLYVIGGSYALAWAAQWLLEDFPRIRFALGLPEEALRKEDLPGYAFFASRLARARAERDEAAVPVPETVE